MFSISIPVKTVLAASFLMGAGCTVTRGDHEPPATTEFYTITAELALARGQPRQAALQYAAAVERDGNPKLLQRAAEVASQTLQPSIVAKVTQRWIAVEPNSADARRAAARAALALYRVDDAASHYRAWLTTAPDGLDAGLADVETDLTTDENIFGARAVADRLASSYPDSPAVHRVQGLTALRADDPQAAAQSLSLALKAAPPAAAATSGRSDNDQDDAQEARRELVQTWSRARILAGDAEEPLGQARARMKQEDSAANRFDYAVLLMTAQREKEAAEQLEILANRPESTGAALRLLGLLEFQDGHMEAAAARFKQVLRTGKFLDDAFYYMAVIEDRNGDSERALQLYSQVKHGENMFPALLRATVLLNQHGASNAAEELLDRLMEDEPERVPEIVNARARMYADAGQLPRASEVLQKAVAQYPDSVELRYARASIFEDQGNIEQALQELSQVLKSRPDDPTAMNALGFTLADHAKELGRARALIERAHSAAPHNAAIADSLGWVLYRQGHFDEALAYLRAAYRDDRGGDIAAHLGEVLWREGARDEAQRIWTEAGIIDADNKLLKRTRQRLQAAD